MQLAPALEAPANVATAINKASRSTGIAFEYLLATAARESSFRPTAKARDSSAAGLFQFIESTWLKTVKEDGTQFGLGGYADRIVKTEDGRYVVPDAKARAEILRLRYDPEAAANLAAAFTQENAGILSERLGRAPTAGELYIAHFMGADRGAQLIDMAQNAPGERADSHFAKAARANRGIFYAGGRARSLGEVYQALVSRHDAVEVAYWPAATESATATSTPDSIPTEPGSPLVATRVASLTDRVLDVDPGLSPAALGSVGAWGSIALAAPRSRALPLSPTASAAREATEPATAYVRDKPVKAMQAAQKKAKSGAATLSAHATAAKRLRQPQPSRVNIASASFLDFDDTFWSDLGRMSR